MPQGVMEHGARAVEQVQRGTDKPLTNDQRKAHMRLGRSDSGNRGHASPRRSHVGQEGNTHGDSDCRDAPHTEPLTRCEDTQAGHSRDATAMATAFEPPKQVFGDIPDKVIKNQ